MELINVIQRWLYPLIDLILMIYCLMKIKKKKGIIFLAIGFGMYAFYGLIHRILILVYHFDTYESLNKFYDTMSYISLFLYPIFAAFIIIGISQIANSNDSVNVKDIQDDLENQTPLIGGIQNQHSQDELIQNPQIWNIRIENIYMYMTVLIAGLISLILGKYFAINEASKSQILLMIIIGAILLLISQIYFLVLFYRIWRFTIDSSYSLNLVPSIDSPGKAVGLLFIPLFGFYWAFKAFGELPKNLNELAQAKGISKTISEDSGIAIAILNIVSLIPKIGNITVFILIFFLNPIYLYSLISMCRSLSEDLMDTQNV